jgi:hypothetical protein
MKAALVVLAIADIVASGWLSTVLTVHRPGGPQGTFVVPYQTHGGVTYISKLDSGVHIALLVGGALLVVAWWLVTRFEKHLDGQPRSR